MEGKLRTYCKIKTSFRSEKYLHINNFTLRAITKLRISSHQIKIETGRYLKLEVNERLLVCNKCDLNKNRGRNSFLLECPSTFTDRQVLIDMINKKRV